MEYPRAAPMLGQHTDALLKRLAGLDDMALESLKARGIIEQLEQH